MRNRKAFSLIELMVVVAIIGILATIAIPSYQKFSARARQTHAKSELSGLFTAEKAFQGEYATYSVNLYSIGFLPEGIDFPTTSPYPPSGSVDRSILYRYYTTGVGGVGVEPPCWSLWPSDIPLDTRGGWTWDGSFDQSYDLWEAEVQNLGLTNSQVCDANTFVGTAFGQLYKGKALYDTWTIDQNRVLRNVQSGL